MDALTEATPFPFDETRGRAGEADGWEAVAHSRFVEHRQGWEMVATGPSSDGDRSIFPPSLHEGLRFLPDPLPTLVPSPPVQDQDCHPACLGQTTPAAVAMDASTEATLLPFNETLGPAGEADSLESVAHSRFVEHPRGWDTVAEGPSSVFPPILHEGLHFLPAPLPTLAPSPPVQDQDCVVEESPSDSAGDEVVSQIVPARWGPLSESAWRLIRSGLEAIHARITLFRENEGGGSGCLSVGVWSFAVVAGLVGALIFMRRGHRREKELLFLLYQEKDQRIRDLLNQIALMSRIINAHEVSVLRNT
ncbi:uncharacterized protein LOC122053253 [Zingiber officinale]|uniref:Transmembrane protein n=1 Tax=Zingiber officinale TaxID=94328 RepID=A0A8J5LNE9_ZINOF|nr:uncharacterized protein LOC122053253 [Zingiber officinale]KAG6522854.1 hypothetical protein ZIOFF_020009 [Zingiber officinale]